MLLWINPPPSPPTNCFSVILRNSELISEHNTGIKTGMHRENERDLPSISCCKTVVN